MHTYRVAYLQSSITQFYEFLVLYCCITLDMCISLLRIFMIKIQKYLLFIYNAVYIARCLVNAHQDNVSAKTVPIRLHHTVLYDFIY